MLRDKIHTQSKKVHKNYKYKEAYVISTIYAVFGALWILFSDMILELLIPNINKYKSYQTYKGWFYILVTTSLVYYLIRRRIRLTATLSSLESELSYQKKLSENIITEAPTIIITWDNMGRILTINPFGEKLTGYTQEELVNSSGWSTIIPEDRNHMVLDTFSNIKNMEIDSAFNYEGALVTKDGRRIDVLWSSKILLADFDDVGEVYVSIGTDIEERKKYELKIRHLAYYDLLTGLPNRFMFEREITKRIKKGDNKFTIAYMDIDNFKHINDSIGHRAGDVFLKYFSESILDIIDDKVFFARLGGDEFAILYPSDFKEDVMKEVEDLMKDINRIWSYDNKMFYMSMSVGIVAYPEHGHNISDLLMKADIAMYASKREGRNRILIYSDELIKVNILFANMANNLQEGLEQEQFYLVYQPQYNLQSKKLTGMEALLRWEHPAEGFISPGEFIPIAERTGQIYRLERWVINKALEQKMLWENQGVSGIVLSINLSTRTLTSDINFSEWEQILSNYSIDFSEIVIEITETANILDVDKVIANLKRLKQIGIRIALDDFGTGYSSLNYLKKLPIDIIKLDKSFIDAIADEGTDTLLIKNVLNIADDLKYEVVAEGIETNEQMECLINYKCEFGQGFLLSKPLSVDNINNLLKNNNSI